MNNSFKIKKGLVVEGDARVTGAIFDSTNAPGTSGQVLTSTVTGTDWKSLAEISGVDGTGTANYLSKWSDADTITNSAIYNSTNYVAINAITGTTFALDVHSSDNAYNTRLYQPSASTGAYVSLLLSGAMTSAIGYIGTGGSAAGNPSFRDNVVVGSQSAHPLVFNTSDAERMRINSAGNVGIGTTSPSAKLQVVGTTQVDNGGINLGGTSSVSGNNPQLRRANSSNDLGIATGGSDRITVLGTGNVGIGTTSPDAKLEVRADGWGTLAEMVRFSTNAAGSGYVNSIVSKQSTGAGSNTILGFDLNTGVASVQSRVLTLLGDGNVGIGTTSPGSLLQVGNAGAAPTGLATITLTGANTAPQISTRPGLYHRHSVGLGVFSDYAISFQVNGSTALSDAMRITNTGNVGIGTTAPASKLQIQGTGTGAWLTINRTDSGTNIVDFTENSTRLGYVGYIASDLVLNNATASNTIFNTSGAERMRITSAGNVGIGTTSPGAKLHVSGGGQYISASASATAFLRLYSNAQTSSQFEIGQGFATATDNIAYLWNVANASMAFGTNSTERMRITSAGNVGIGTTSPAEKLEVVGNAILTISDSRFRGGDTAGRLVVSNSNTTSYITLNGSTRAVGANEIAFVANSTSAMLITSTGNVGIGTASPASKLHVGESGAPAQLWLQRTDGYNPVKLIGGTLADGSGFKITMNTTDAFAITSAGNVGIGTTAPGTKLQVAGTIRATGTTGIVDVDPLYGAFRFYNGSTFYGGFYNDAVLSAGNAVDLVSYVATGDYYIGSATTAKAVKVEQGGNVGIGTTSPTEKLDVNGVVNAASFSAGGTAGFTGTVVFASNPPGSQMLDFQGGLLVSVS